VSVFVAKIGKEARIDQIEEFQLTNVVLNRENHNW
jgi:hypothetical protein